MFWKKVMILFDAKKEKKVEKEDRTQAGQTSPFSKKSLLNW